ncbi:hypothetical protein QBC36DRAFT_340145 [Triangularia setosa]|uniref:Uncharacterized protein n=1 Tax=Triangularia setosa TaxID=2587417 RepID=A0AAN6VX64_9PEZI|nr:hypothetical protein QBC36DRAFT_340145 [Podospora setosa]
MSLSRYHKTPAFDLYQPELRLTSHLPYPITSALPCHLVHRCALSLPVAAQSSLFILYTAGSPLDRNLSKLLLDRPGCLYRTAPPTGEDCDTAFSLAPILQPERQAPISEAYSQPINRVAALVNLSSQYSVTEVIQSLKIPLGSYIITDFTKGFRNPPRYHYHQKRAIIPSRAPSPLASRFALIINNLNPAQTDDVLLLTPTFASVERAVARASLRPNNPRISHYL